MKKNILIRISLVLAIFVVISGVAGLKSTSDIKDAAKSLIRRGVLLYKGESAFVQSRLDQQVNQQDVGVGLAQQAIETAVLPLQVSSSKIYASVKYPLGAGSMTSAGERLIIMDRLGSLYLSDGDKVVPLNVPHVPNGIADFIKYSANQDLNIDTFRTHSIAYSSTQKKLYVSYEKYVNSGVNRFEISSISFDEKTWLSSGNWVQVYKSDDFTSKSYGLAGGGKILVSGERVFFAVGDYGFYAAKGQPDLHSAQNPRSSFGKVYEILPNGQIEMLSLGHRNTQGLVFSDAGQLINVEQGPQGGDELNIIEKGSNYGWPIDTFGTDYGKYTWKYQQDNSKRRLKWPLYSFVPSVAADSIIQVRGFHERWNGDFLVGSLKAQTMFRMKITQNRVMLNEPIWIGHRIREIVELTGRLILLTDDGLLMTIKVNAADVITNTRGVDSVTGKALAKCMACHHMGPTNPSHLAPSLSGINARNVASDTYSKYSDAMKKFGGTWTKDRLQQFLKDPALTVPGTAMPKPDLSDDEREEAIKELLVGKQ